MIYFILLISVVAGEELLLQGPRGAGPNHSNVSVPILFTNGNQLEM